MATASSKSVSVDEIEDLLTCSMCSETLNEPRSLPCLHNFCKVCLGKYVDRLRGVDKNIETFPCPRCRSEFTLKSDQDVAEISSSHFIKNMLEIVAIQRKAKASPSCSQPDCQDSAINHCTSCKKFLCKKCSQSHDQWLNDHDVLSIQELSNPNKIQVKMRSKLYCMEHEDKILEYYCETCKELSCIHCMLLNHQKQNHSCVAVSREVTRKQRETLQSSCTTLDEKFSEGKEALNTICDVMKSLEKNAKTAKDQINEQKDNILKAVAEKLGDRAKKMNEEVDEVYDELQTQLSKQHDEIKDYLDKVQGSVSLATNLLKRGSIEEILSSQKVIDGNIEKLGNEQPQDLTAVNDGGIEYVPGDIGDIKLEEVVDKMGCVEGNIALVPDNLKNSSRILNGEIALMSQLQKWLGEKCKWNLCYAPGTHGWTTQDFHRQCDNKGPTVVLVKANDCIFGGYTDQHWDGSGAWKRSVSSFLFSLRNKDNLAPFIANIKQGQEQQAIFCYSASGPRFGGGNDLCMNTNPHAYQSSSNFGCTYQLPAGYVYGSEQAKNLLAGQYNFMTTEIEVFN